MSITSGIRSGIRSSIRSGLNPSLGGTIWTLTRTSGGPAWDAGAFSSAGFSGNGRIEVTLTGTRDYMFGLSTSDGSASYDTINYCLYLGAADDTAVFENGVSKFTQAAGTLTGQAGAVFAVKRTGTTVTFEKNGVAFYTSLTASTGTLFGDVSIYLAPTAISGVTLYSGSTPLATSWTNLVSVSAT